MLNSTDSEFWGFVKDQYTTLKEAYDRILATEVTARWRFNWTGDDAARAGLGAGVRPGPPPPAGRPSPRRTRSRSSRPCTRWARGSSSTPPEIDEVRLSLPNKHHFLVDLEPFGLKNDNEVYFAADRPYGLIEGTVLRDGAEPAIPVTD